MISDEHYKTLNDPIAGVEDPSNDKLPAGEDTTRSEPPQTSTGPRTRHGKDKSKQNATTYGIFSQAVVLKGESRAEVNALRNGLCDYFQPEGAMEEVLVDKLAAYLWRQRRLIVAEGEANGRLSGSIVQFNDGSPKLDVLLRYETTLDRSIDRVLAQLERHQRMRHGQPVPPQINVNVSPA
jgi:hypothetical protein